MNYSDQLTSSLQSDHKIHLIVAIGEDGSIGKNGDLIWKISEDLQNFKKMTIGHPVIMGRKTWESLPKRPLPNRRNIVITRQNDFKAEGAEVVNSVEKAIESVKGEEPFIIGGAEIYKAFMPFVTHFHLTKVFSTCKDADTFLTLPSDLKLISSSAILKGNNPLSPQFQFLTLTSI